MIMPSRNCTGAPFREPCSPMNSSDDMTMAWRVPSGSRAEKIAPRNRNSSHMAGSTATVNMLSIRLPLPVGVGTLLAGKTSPSFCSRIDQSTVRLFMNSSPATASSAISIALDSDSPPGR